MNAHSPVVKIRRHLSCSTESHNHILRIFTQRVTCKVEVTAGGFYGACSGHGFAERHRFQEGGLHRYSEGIVMLCS